MVGLFATTKPFHLHEYINLFNFLCLAKSTFTYDTLKWFLAETFEGISDHTLLNSLGLLNDASSVDIVNFSLPNLPAPPNAFRGIRRKSSSLRRWLAICTDDLIG